MKDQGGVLVKHYRELAFMGFAEVIANLRKILGNIKYCKSDILQYNPDVLILVDYPGFNLRIAKFAFPKGIKIFYYISPQVWAWKKSRVKTIKKVVNRMFVILPSEKYFYKKYNYDVDFVGHPLLDAIENHSEQLGNIEEFRKNYDLSDKPVIAVLPGSRRQEITKMLSVMLSVIHDFPDYRFVIAGAPSVPENFYYSFIKDFDIKIVFGKTYNLLKNSCAAIVTSGTATLETALLNIPEVVCYKGSFFSYQIAKRIVDVKFISLVNLIMDRKIVDELIQNDFNYQNLKNALIKILDKKNREKIFGDYKILREKLGAAGASEKTAELMVKYLKSQKFEVPKV